MNEYKKEYMRERRRAQRLVNAYKNRGYDVKITIPKLVKIPTQASIKKLQKINSRVVRLNSYAPDLATGERINFNQFKLRYPRAKSPKSVYDAIAAGAVYVDDMNITHFERVVSNYPDRITDIVMTRLSGAIAVYGRKKVDDALGEMIVSGDIIEPSDGYNYRAVMEMMESLASLLRISNEEKQIIHDEVLSEMDSQEYYDGEFLDW